MKHFLTMIYIAMTAMIMTACSGNGGNSTQQDSADQVEQNRSTQEKQDAAPTWKYTQDVDDLTGKTTGINAAIASTNSITSNFGTQDRLVIQLSYNGITGEPSNMFGIAFEKGDCRFADKHSQGFYAVFDNGEVDDTWTLCNGGDNTAIVMISDGLSDSESKISSFINNLKKSKTCRIQVNVDGVGMKTFDFNCEGLNWQY